MAVNIDTELETIASEAKGELVRSAIADAAEAINTEAELDITTELETIRNSRWGYEIRESIHDALWKLSNNPGGSSGIWAGFATDAAFGCISDVIAGHAEDVEE